MLYKIGPISYALHHLPDVSKIKADNFKIIAAYAQKLSYGTLY